MDGDDDGHDPSRPGLGGRRVCRSRWDRRAGDRVERTGLALVHEGEYIMPAAGSEALLSPAPGSGHGGELLLPGRDRAGR